MSNKLTKKQRDALTRLPVYPDEWEKRVHINTRRWS